MALLNFKSGLQAGLANAAFSAGTVYVTEDTKKLYVDLQNKSSVADGRICIGDFQLVRYSTGTAQEALNALKRMKSNINGAEGQAENAALQHEVDMQESLMLNAKRLTEEETNILTDACKIFTLKDEDVYLVEGEVTNIKITYPYDLKLANTILEDNHD
mgnify:CR=1 FL=1